jgi:hypothetical protein
MYWLVTNGYTGEGPVGVLLEAPDETAAVKVASEVLRAEAEQQVPYKPGPLYPENYWQPAGLHAERVELPLLGYFG